MRPINSDEVRIELNDNIFIFNQITDEHIPTLYFVSEETTPKSLENMRLNFDCIANEYDFNKNTEITRFYLKIRERIEALRDMKKYEIKYTL